MTREQIIRMAREADEGFETDTFHEESLVGMDAIERFASLIAAAEREACAELCLQWNASHPEALAAAIRARGNT